MGDPTREPGTVDPATTVSLDPNFVSRPTLDGEAAVWRPHLLPKIAGHEIVAELGRGGMGVVYQARQLALGRTIAVKVLLGGVHANEQRLARFSAEAQSVARLQHPGIVQVFEVGETDGLPFYSMEYVAGGSLAQRLTGAPQNPRDAATLVLKVARAIQAAHERGVVHRDLKPANILLTEEGEPKVADFGLAKQLDSESGQTHTGEVLGTPSYMAPEQAAGKVREIGPATDVYALGVILYEMITGRVPFVGPNPVETIHQLLSQDATPPRAFSSRIPRDLETICLKCLQKEPVRRYATADALAADLQRYLNGEPIAARPVSGLERFGRWCRRNPVVAGLVAGLFASLTIGLFVATKFALDAAERADSERQHRAIAERREREAVASAAAEAEAKLVAQQKEAEATAAKTLAERRENEAREATAKEAIARSLAEEKERRARDAEAEAARRAEALNKQVYRNSIWLAYREWQAQNGNQAASLLAACDAKQRGWEWDYCNRLTRGHELRLRKDGAEEFTGVAFSPDGARLVASAELGSVLLYDAFTGRELAAAQFPKPKGAPYGNRRVHTIEFTPDGKLVALASLDGVVRLLDAERLDVIAEFKEFTYGSSSVAISPDGALLAASSGNEGVVDSYEIRVWEIASKRRIAVLAGHTHSVTGIAFHPSGERIASGALDRRVKTWDLRSGRELTSFPLDQGEAFGIAYTPDGSRVVAACTDSLVHVWDAESGVELPPLRGHRGAVECVACSADGKRFASGSQDGTVRLWDAATGEELWALQGHGWSVRQVAFSPDGRRLASAGADRTVKVWDVTRDRQHRAFDGHRNPINDLRVSADGRWLVTLAAQMTSVHNEYALWDLAREELVRLDADFTRGDGLYLPMRSLDLDASLRALSGSSFHEINHVLMWEPATGRRLATFDASPRKIHMTAYSPDGKSIACVSDDGTIRFLDPSDGREIRSLPGHDGPLLTLALSPDGRYLASTGGDKTLIRRATGEVLHEFPRGRAPPPLWKRGRRRIAFSRDGRRVAIVDCAVPPSSAGDAMATVFDVESGAKVAELRGHTRPINSIAFNADGRRIATGGDDDLVKVWDVEGAAELLSLRGHIASVNCVEFSPDGRKLISGGGDSRAIVWDASPDPPAAWVPEAALPAEARPLIAALAAANPHFSGAASVVRVEAGKVVALSFAGQRGLANVAPLAELPTLASLDLSGTSVADLAPLAKSSLTTLDLSDSFVADLAPLRGSRLEELDLRGTAVADYSPLAGTPLRRIWCDREQLPAELLAGLPALELLNGRPTQGTRASAAADVVLAGHRGDVRTVSLHPSGESVASGGLDGTVRVWNVAEPRGEPTVIAHPAPVTRVIHSPDGKLLAWATGDSRRENKTGSVWLAPATRLDERRTLLVDAASVECLVFSKDGARLAAGGIDGSVRVWDAASGEPVASPPNHPQSVLSLDYSRDGTQLLIGGGNWSDRSERSEAVVWDAAAAKPLRRFKLDHGVQLLTFMPDESRLAASNWGWLRSTTFVAAKDGTYQTLLRAHEGRVRWHVFFRDGADAATVAEDDAVLLFDVATQTKWGTLVGHTGPLWQISVNAAGDRLATASSDGTVRVWSVPPKPAIPPPTAPAK